METTHTTTKQSTDLRWLKNAEHWGEWERFDESPQTLDPRQVAHGRVATGTGDRESIWLMKSGSSPEARFYATSKGQVGPRHGHILAAYCWAYGNGYLQVCEPGEIFQQIAAREEVLSGGAIADRHAEVDHSDCE